jgi:hypothetical protein
MGLLAVAARETYIYYSSIIAHMIKDHVATILLKKRLHLCFLKKNSAREWGETDNGLHPDTFSR